MGSWHWVGCLNVIKEQLSTGSGPRTFIQYLARQLSYQIFLTTSPSSPSVPLGPTRPGRPYMEEEHEPIIPERNTITQLKKKEGFDTHWRSRKSAWSSWSALTLLDRCKKDKWLQFTPFWWSYTRQVNDERLYVSRVKSDSADISDNIIFLTKILNH